MTNDCWLLSSDKSMSGSLSQAIGLAEALGLQYTIKTTPLKRFWHRFPVRFIPHSLSVFFPSSNLTPPFPSLVIASAKRTIPAALAIKKLSPSTKIIYLQNPRYFHTRFDAIITPFHDKDERHDTIKSLGALHRASPNAIFHAKNQVPAFITNLPKPLHVFLLGGNARSHCLDKKTTETLLHDILSLIEQTNGSIVVLPSRRTPGLTTQALSSLSSHPRIHVCDGSLPYLGLLGYADQLIVTEESVSMISESCSTGTPTHLYPLKKKRKAKRLALFHQSMIQSGRAKMFSLPLDHWEYQPLNETERVAKLVQKKLHLLEDQHA